MSTNEIGKIYQRPWGTYQTLALSKNYQVKILTTNPGGRLSLQKHSKRAEHWVVVQGHPTITLDQTVKTYQVNDRIFIPQNTAHRIENLTAEPTIIIEVQIGEYLGEDDIVRLEDIYGRL
jgi:mannose-6-phosphate isomerase